jgi:hypothetical protein
MLQAVVRLISRCRGRVLLAPVQGRIAEMPGVITAAPTLDEAKEMLRDALAEYLASFESAPVANAPGATSEELELKIAS